MDGKFINTMLSQIKQNVDAFIFDFNDIYPRKDITEVLNIISVKNNVPIVMMGSSNYKSDNKNIVISHGEQFESVLIKTFSGLTN